MQRPLRRVYAALSRLGARPSKALNGRGQAIGGRLRCQSVSDW